MALRVDQLRRLRSISAGYIESVLAEERSRIREYHMGELRYKAEAAKVASEQARRAPLIRQEAQKPRWSWLYPFGDDRDL